MNVTEKHIKGLQLSSSTKKTREEDGQTKADYIVSSRPLTVEDVLAARETEDGIFFVTTDGQKYFWDRRTGKSSKTNN
jgi:hypothetical protein